MSVQVLSLANGQLGTVSKGLLYPSPNPITLTTIVKSIRLVNTDTQPRTVNLYFAPNAISGNIRRIAPPNMTIPAGGLVIDDQEITMAPNDQILGDASAAGVIDYVISGIQR
jgi:hypothetical protein